ncbi:GT-D fold domain-containing glycosyltransferase [Pediococcus sp. M21F004]|uniref:GT-D fold domain-containing glycosyltransferase n=1 Tax=Pediococcus sp. M21F004 TaxID=3390033 RepID=UPI003DA6DD48
MTLKSKLKSLELYKQMQKINTSNYLLVTHPIVSIKYKITSFFMKTPRVKDIDSSIHELVNSNFSLSRYGDGEFRWIDQSSSYQFQENDPILSNRLLEILNSSLLNHRIGIPNVFSGVGELSKTDGLAWEKLINKYGKKWSSYLNSSNIYLDANLSRPYIDREKKENSGEHFKNLQKLWNKKDVLIVEGRETRFGVNNDLLDNAANITRILCPAENAFSSYNRILNSVIENHTKKAIVLVALGPTATVLCFDLCKAGIRAIDIGHLDIEYEWFLRCAEEKEPIEGKYVNEVKGGNLVTNTIINPKFLDEVVDSID